MAEENAFVRDLCKAQAEMENAAFDKTNPHFKSRYASLAAVRNATKPLSKYGFAVIHTMRVQFDADGQPLCQILTTTLEHVSGETRQDERLIPLGTAQQMGSEETYQKRRGLSGLTAIASEEDDDAEGGTVHPLSAHAARQSGFYPTAEAAIRNCQSQAEMRDWWKANQDDIRALPPHWRAKLEGEKDRAKLRLIEEAEGKPLTQALKASLALTDEEKAEIDPPDTGSHDPANFLDDLDSQMSGANDEATIMEIWAEFGGIKEIMSSADQDKAQMIFERHIRGMKASSAVKLMKAGKK